MLMVEIAGVETWALQYHLQSADSFQDYKRLYYQTEEIQIPGVTVSLKMMTAIILCLT